MNKDFSRICELASRFVAVVREFRSQSGR
jgi:hypothetical protein